MPKPKEDSYSEQEMRDWLKARGYDIDTGGKTPDTHAPANAVPPAATPTAPAAPGASSGIIAPLTKTATELHRTFAGEGEPGKPPTYEQMDWQQKAAQGGLREGARFVTGAGKLAGQLVPTSVRRTLGDLAEQVPGVKRMEEFGAHEAEGPMEYLGMGAMDVAASALTPNLGLGSLVSKFVPATRTVPTMTRVATAPVWVNPLGAGGRFMQTAPQFVAGTTKVANPSTVRAARGVGNFAENIGKGAVGGAVMDPEDPKTGAEYGGVASATTQAVGRALRSGPGQHLLGSLARYIPAGAAYALLHQLGHEIAGELAAGGLAARTFAHGVAHDIRGFSTPVGQYLRGVGEAGARKTGQFMQRNLPAGIEAGKAAAAGYTPSQGADAASDWWERTQRPTVTVPRRSIYEEQGREEEQ